MIDTILSANFNTLYNITKKQFSESKGLHLNSKDWKPYIKTGVAEFYNFLISGIIQTTTTTKTNNNTYDQIIQFDKYKDAENSLLLMFLLNIEESKIIEFLATFLYNTRTRVYCSCPAFKFWGFEYLLTRMNSVYGPGEYRYPIERNPNKEGIFCKHLWVISESLQNKKIKFATGLIPFYKKAFGLNNITRYNKYKKSLGKNGILEIHEAAKEDIINTKNKTILKVFNSIITDSTVKNIEISKPRSKSISDPTRAEPMMKGLNRINKQENILDNLEGLDLRALGME